jgi:hypothetical protein
MKTQHNWMRNPTRKQAIAVFLVWLTSEVLLFAAATDFFRESPFKKEFLGVNFLNFVTTVIVLVTVSNYFRQRKQAKN